LWKRKITANTMQKNVGVCHCESCRRWTGGPLMVVDCGTDVIFEGDENIKIFDSSDWAERAFCTNCGTHLFYRLKESNQHIMPVGLFENDDAFVFNHQVFIEQKPSYYCFSNETEDMTGEELFAKYAPSPES
jgi:hypothetical protein